MTPTYLRALAGLALATFLAGAAGDEVEKGRCTAVAGARTLVNYHAHWDANCNSMRVPAIEVTRPPAHGAIDIAEGDFVVRNKRLGTVDCSGRTVRGVGVYYTAAAGYSGPDGFAYDNRSSGQPPLHFDLELSVRATTGQVPP